MSEKNEQSQSFEQSMARLEQIVRAMERGDWESWQIRRI